MKNIIYLLLISFYYYKSYTILKGLPVLFLYLYTNNIAFLYAAAGDTILETNFLAGVILFILATKNLSPDINPFDIVLSPWLSVVLALNPLIFHFFNPYEYAAINIYLLMLINLVSCKTLQSYIFILSDVFVLCQHVFDEPRFSYFSLPLYWTSMLLYSRF